MSSTQYRPQHSVLVTDGEQRSALAAVRALGRAGHRVWVCSKRRRNLGGASRYAVGSACVHDSLATPDAFRADIVNLVRERAIEVVLPMTDDSMLAALAARQQLAPAVLPFPDLEMYRAISNKHDILAVAPRFGIAAPKQRVVLSEECARAVDVRNLSFPIVVKPARSVSEHAGTRRKQGVSYARNAVELEKLLRAADPGAYPLLLQQRVVGPGIGIFLILWDGEIIASFAHRRLREKPPGGGVSVYRESIEADPDLVRRSRALLDYFGWHGIAMIEYKVDAATGTPYLMEINARFWGSLQLAIDAGVDFPNLLIAAALDGHRKSVTAYRTGIRSRWWWGDVDQLLARFRHSPEELALPPDSPTRWQAARQFLQVWNPNDRNEILRFEDPWPFVRETIDWFRRA